MLAEVGQDLRYAIRALARSRGFAAVVVLTLALGVGVNTAVFSVVNALMFRPLPVRGGERLVVLASSRPPGGTLGPASYADLQDYRSATQAVLEDIAGYTVGFIGLAPEGGRPARVLATWVTGNYFRLLDIQPALGRLVRDAEGTPGRVDSVVVLGHTTWQRRFGSDASVVGRTVRLNGRPCTVIGVAPAGFMGTFAFSEPEVYVPINWSGAYPHDDRRARTLHTIARLRPGVTAEQAQATVTVVAARLEREHPQTNAGIGASVVPERLARPEENNARSNRPAAAVILILVGLVLLAAAVNVTGLLIARAAGRTKELAVRASLGASRRRLIQHLFAESAILGIAGGVAGIVLGTAATAAIAAVRLPGDLPVRFDFRADVRVMAYALGLTAATAFSVGIVAARRVSPASVGEALRRAAYGSTPSIEGQRLRKVLVAAQVAIAFVLAVAGGLFARSLAVAQRADLGFTPGGVLNVQMDVEQVAYGEAQGRSFFDEVERRVRALPGVEDTAFAFSVPFGYVRLDAGVRADEGAITSREELRAGKNIVGRDYFPTLGIGIESGRSFAESDTHAAPPVAVVNRRFAELLWPDRNPIGRRFIEARADARPIEVVGVTGTGKYRALFEDPLPYFFVPMAQNYTAMRVLHVRTTTAPEAIAPAVERVIHALEPDLPLYDVQGMNKALDGGYGRFLVRAAALFAAVLALLALTLTLVGLYGLVTYLTGERTREIGVRVALGARPANISMLVAGEAAKLGAVGAAAGIAAAYAGAQMVKGLLFGVAPDDGFSFALALVCLLLVTVAAAWLPARRAAGMDPLTALRTE